MAHVKKQLPCERPLYYSYVSWNVCQDPTAFFLPLTITPVILGSKPKYAKTLECEYITEKGVANCHKMCHSEICLQIVIELNQNILLYTYYSHYVSNLGIVFLSWHLTMW